MNDKRPKKDGIEVSSQSIEEELAAIKDRLNAIETIESISNAATVRKYVEEHLKTDAAKTIMAECAEPKTKSYLQEKLGFKTSQALDHHLRPLREADLLYVHVRPDRTVVLEWSRLFRGLSKPIIRSILKQ